MRVMRMLARRSEGIDCWEILFEAFISPFFFFFLGTGGFEYLDGWIISVQAMCQLDWVYVFLEKTITRFGQFS